VFVCSKEKGEREIVMNVKIMRGLALGVLVAVCGGGEGMGTKKLETAEDFKKALEKEKFNDLFEALKEINNGNMEKTIKTVAKDPSTRILTRVNKIIENKDLDSIIKSSIKNVDTFNKVLSGDAYKFYTELSKINISQNGKTINSVVLANTDVADAIKTAQNKIASALLNENVNYIKYYSDCVEETKSDFPDYSCDAAKEAMAGPKKPDNWDAQLNAIAKEKGESTYAKTKLVFGSGIKEILFISKDIDENKVVDGDETIKVRLEANLDEIADVYKNVWLFDCYVRTAKAVICEKTLELKEFKVCKTDCKDITVLLGNNIKFDNDEYKNCVVQKNVLDAVDIIAVKEDQTLYGFHDYVVNVFTAAKLFAWASQVNETIEDTGNFANAIKTLKDALDACTGPTVKLDELKKAISGLAVSADGKKQLYDINKIDELKRCEFKDACDEWIKKTEEEKLKKEEKERIEKEQKDKEEKEKLEKEKKEKEEKLKKEEEEKLKKNLTPSKPEDLPKALQLLKAKLLALATQLKK